MAGTEASTDLKVVDASLWWDSFNLLLTELENVSPSSEFPPYLEEKLKENHTWLLDTVKRFKTPNQKSRDALDAKQVKIGSHQLTIQPQLKDAALKFSSLMGLDEVQSYILVDRSVQQNTFDQVLNKLPHLVMVQLYTERQCLLKCTRQLLSHALFVGSRSKENHVIWVEAQKLISEGLESNLFSLLEELLSCSYPDQLDVDLYALWAEETLVEDNLVLDILFLAYYESFCSCNSGNWKKLFVLYEGVVSGSLNLMKLSISTDAIRLVNYAKVQLLLILIETLELETLLQMVHDEIPFRQGSLAFSLADVQEMDAMISQLDAFLTKEVGSLILAWAVFLCLVSSLPGKDDNSVLMEINHVSYVCQAIESASLSYFVDVLESNVLMESDGPIAGFRSVLRTLVSAFLASYEISLQSEDHNLKLILEVLCQIYRGEESLCIQFWDRDSIVDGPIRCLLCSLEGEFPFKAAELVCMLSALAEGAWPAQCVYDFLDKSVGVSSLFEMSRDSMVDDSLKIVKTNKPLHVPGVEGLIIPSNTRGQIVRMIDCCTAVVRWEYRQSGLVVLLLRLAQELYLGSTQEVLVILDLLNRLVSFNMAVCYTLTVTGKSCDEVTSEEEQRENCPCIDVVMMICSLVKSHPPTHHGAAAMSMGVSILAKMLKCSPHRVGTMIVKSDIFDVAVQKHQFEVGSNGLYSEWLLSGKLAKMLCIDCEENDCLLTLSVLDLTIQLLKTAFEENIVLALVNFALQCVLVDHDVWRYKSKQARWKVTLKVLEVVETCILSIAHSQKFGNIIQDMLLSDSSIHTVLFRMVCIAAAGLEKLWSSRLYDIVDIEGLHQAICSALDILFRMASSLSKDLISSSMFHQALLSPVSKPVPVVAALISLISYFQDTKMQINAAKLMSMMFVLGDSFQSVASSNSCLGMDPQQISRLRSSVHGIFSEQFLGNEDLIMSALDLLTSAARYQPAFLNALITSKGDSNYLSCDTSIETHHSKSVEMMGSKETNIADIIMLFVRKSDDLMKRNPSILLKVLNFLKALWQGAPQFTNILDKLKNTDKFWSHLIDCVTLFSNMPVPENPLDKLSDTGLRNLANRYYCQSDVLEIISFEIFLQKKLSHAELLMKENSEPSNGLTDRVNGTKFANHQSTQSLSNVLSSSFKSSLGNLIKSYASCTYDSKLHLQANVAASLFLVHMMERLKNSDMGHTCVSVVEKVLSLSEKMKNLPAFSDLLTRYTQSGYSQGKDLQYLILNDLFYHLEGVLEGRQVNDRSFKELMLFLLQENFLSTYLSKSAEGLQELGDGVTLYNLSLLQSDLALEQWDLSEWKASKSVAEKMLHILKDVNCMALLSRSKLSALKALVAMLSLYSNHSTVNGIMNGGEMPSQLTSSCIDHTCQCLHATVEALGTGPNASDDVVDILASQVQLLIYLTKPRRENLSSSTFVLILKTLGHCLRVLSGFRLSDAGVCGATKHILMLILFSLKLNFKEAHFGVRFADESVEDMADMSSASLVLLPILCQYIQLADHYMLSLSAIGIILRSFSTPDVWFPIIQKHLQLHYIIQKLLDKNPATIPVVLEFLLTLARVREGARMLLDAGFLASLRGVLADLSDYMPILVVQSERSPSNAVNNEKPKHIWGLCLAVVTSVIQSLGDVSSSGIVDYVIAHVLVEKADVVSYFLSAPEFPANDHEKKRARSLKRAATLSTLKETEHTLMLVCVVARHWNSWNKAMREMDSQFRERIIHLLAFISRGIHLNRELPGRIVPFLCHPVVKEEFEWYKKPSFVNSRNGWFALSPLGCGLDPKFSSLSSRTSALVTKGQSNDTVDPAPQTQFSDMTAIQIYKNTFLLLKFLCIQAEGAAKRAEEVGYVDLAEFPELPMPDILHNLQDQAIVIVTELCEANKSKQVTPEIQGVCLLLLQITIMALYLEFCVIQICGIRPVLGHAEDFLKQLRLLSQATMGHAFLKDAMSRLRQLVSFVYPDLLQANALI